jgi:hypothetical protein
MAYRSRRSRSGALLKSTVRDVSNSALVAILAAVAVGVTLTDNPWVVGGVAVYVYAMAIALIEWERR